MVCVGSGIDESIWNGIPPKPEAVDMKDMPSVALPDWPAMA